MKNWAVLAGFLCFAIMPAHANMGSIIVCHVSGFADLEYEVRLSLPDRLSEELWTFTREPFKPKQLLDGSVGDGKILFVDTSREHDLVVTRLPSETTSLLGFFWADGAVATVKVDAFEPGHPITIFESYSGATMRGSCK